MTFYVGLGAIICSEFNGPLGEGFDGVFVGYYAGYNGTIRGMFVIYFCGLFYTHTNII